MRPSLYVITLDSTPGIQRETSTGIGYYLSLLSMLKAANIEPVVVMFHHDLPLALESEYSGFLRLNFRIHFEYNPRDNRIVSWKLS